VIKSGKIGQLVANDFTGAIVSAQLMEVDPTTGRKLDYLQVARALETLRTRVEKESGGAVRVHIIGFAKVMGAVGDGARGVLTLFGLSIIITAVLVWYYAGRWKLAGAPVLCSFIAVLWQLGLLTALGYGIDPLSILVPFLIFAIGVSHGVQMMRAFRSAVFSGCDNSLDAAKNAFRQLLVPGGVALIADTFGFLTILEIKIQSIRELAISASLGVCVIIITNLFLLPIILSSLRLPPTYGEWVAKRRAGTDRIWARISSEMKPGPSGHQGGSRYHFANFIDVLRSRKKADLHAPIEEAHISCTLVHLANASYRLGRTLNFDPKSEQVIGDHEANRLLRDADRGYRRPFCIPERI